MIRACAFALFGSVFATLALAQTPVVGIFLDFENIPGKVSVQVMKKEVDALLKSSGVALDWRMADENDGSESFDGLVVLKFRGKCKVDSEAVTFASGALGTTLVDNGRILPFSEVKCDAVRQS